MYLNCCSLEIVAQRKTIHENSSNLCILPCLYFSSKIYFWTHISSKRKDGALATSSLDLFDDSDHSFCAPVDEKKKRITSVFLFKLRNFIKSSTYEISEKLWDFFWDSTLWTSYSFCYRLKRKFQNHPLNYKWRQCLERFNGWYWYTF